MKSLDDFFQRGNKIVVFGSVIYDPSSATDIDYSLFQKGRRSITSKDRKDVEEALVLGWGSGLKCDFTGRRDVIYPEPYDVENLPPDDRRLDGYFLTGRFFPDDGFLRAHYREVYGERYIAGLWKNFADYVLVTVPNLEDRMHKRHKDILLLLAATKELAENSSSIKEAIGKARAGHKAVLETYQSGRNMLMLQSKTEAMISEFINEVSGLL